MIPPVTPGRASPQRLTSQPLPATDEALGRALALAREGADFKAVVERVLLELDEDSADALMLLSKESRGAWALCLEGGRGRALFLGNAFSGTVTALASLGFEVVLADRSPPRLAFARTRDAALSPDRVRHLVLGFDRRLPFTDGSFDLVVQEDGLPHPATGWGHDLAELGRVARGEVVVTADNRLAYKLSTGRHGVFRVPGPLAWARRALAPRRGELTLKGYRRRLAACGAGVRAFALYPHGRDFSHVVALDAERPRLTIGPRERSNRVKLFAHRAGLFPLLTPSFALIAGSAARPRIEQVLDALAERLGEARPQIETLIASRSNTGVLVTSPVAGGAGHGGWVLHVPLSPTKRRLVETHVGFLERIPLRFPFLPVPELLFAGELEGVWLAAERRLEGIGAPQLAGGDGAEARMVADAARHLGELALGPPEAFDESRFETLVAERLRRVQKLCAVESTARAIERHLDELRETLVGRSLPLVLYHADLRAKHVLVREEGSVSGFLDWGASEEAYLPYVDLLHLIAQQRKQEIGGPPERAWRLLRDRRAWRPHEREALDGYARRLGLDDEYRLAIERSHALFVAGMAERNWDFSRPRWVHRQYGI